MCVCACMSNRMRLRGQYESFSATMSTNFSHFSMPPRETSLHFGCVWETQQSIRSVNFYMWRGESHRQPLGFFIWNKYFIECSSVPFWSLLLSRTYTDSFIWFSWSRFIHAWGKCFIDELVSYYLPTFIITISSFPFKTDYLLLIDGVLTWKKNGWQIEINEYQI